MGKYGQFVYRNFCYNRTILLFCYNCFLCIDFKSLCCYDAERGKRSCLRHFMRRQIPASDGSVEQARYDQTGILRLRTASRAVEKLFFNL